MEIFELRSAIWTAPSDPGDDRLHEFLRTGRVAGGSESRAFLCDLFAESCALPVNSGR